MKGSSAGGFLGRWIGANAWSESAGLGTTFLIGHALAPGLTDATEPAVLLAGALGAVALGAVLEGVVVGAAQARVLRRVLPALPAGHWVGATAAGAGLAWLLGMLPSTVLALTADVSATAAHPPEPSGLAQLGLALLLGAATGPVLGMGQWFVLRRHVRRAGRWVAANALAWALAMPVIFAGMGLLPWKRGGVPLVVGLYLVSGLAGAAAGAVHGRILLTLLPDRE